MPRLLLSQGGTRTCTFTLTLSLDALRPLHRHPPRHPSIHTRPRPPLSRSPPHPPNLHRHSRCISSTHPRPQSRSSVPPPPPPDFTDPDLVRDAESRLYDGKRSSIVLPNPVTASLGDALQSPDQRARVFSALRLSLMQIALCVVVASAALNLKWIRMDLRDLKVAHEVKAAGLREKIDEEVGELEEVRGGGRSGAAKHGGRGATATARDSPATESAQAGPLTLGTAQATEVVVDGKPKRVTLY